MYTISARVYTPCVRRTPDGASRSLADEVARYEDCRLLASPEVEWVSRERSSALQAASLQPPSAPSTKTRHELLLILEP